MFLTRDEANGASRRRQVSSGIGFTSVWPQAILLRAGIMSVRGTKRNDPAPGREVRNEALRGHWPLWRQGSVHGCLR
jgi:hypothetical protein